MPSLPITATVPWIQYTATGGQTVFNVPYIFFAPTDIQVYYTPVGNIPDDVTDLIAINANYTVTQNFTTYTGTITLVNPATAGDLITIVRNMPNTRTNYYIQGSPITADTLNYDSEAEVLMIQQNNYVVNNRMPRYQFTDQPIYPNDILLPILGANEIWVKDPTNTFIDVTVLPGSNIPLPTIANTIAIFTNTAGGLASLPPINNAVLTSTALGVPVWTATALNGQLIIGSSVGAPAAATLTPGPGVSIVNGPNSITISAAGGGLAWTDVTTATQALAIANGYVTDRAGGVVYTLPATAGLGDEISIVGKLGITSIAQNANQQIVMAGASSTVGIGGSAVGTNVGDCIDLICITAGASTVWRARNWVGNWTIT